MASSSPSSSAMAMQTTFQVVEDNEAATEDAGTRDNSDAGAPQQSSRLSSYMSANYSHDSLATDDMHLMNSFTEETFLEMLDFGSGEPLPAALTLEAVHAAVASERYHVLGAPSTKMLTRISGTGLAPWEIHRPQKFVRDLVLRGCFSGRVLDAGCGIGDNALFIAKACPQAHVTAVDVSPRCVAFATAKAGLRRMTSGLITLETASLTEPEPERQAACVSSPASDGTFDVVLDSSTFHCFCDADRELYAASLRRLLRPGGKLFVNCMSEAETRPGGPRRVSVAELLSMFNRQSGWEVEVIEDSVIELHPTFWGGQTVSRLYTVRKL